MSKRVRADCRSEHAICQVLRCLHLAWKETFLSWQAVQRQAVQHRLWDQYHRILALGERIEERIANKALLEQLAAVAQ